MPVTVADLVAKLSFDVSGVDKGITDLKSSLGGVEQSVKNTGKAFQDVEAPLRRNRQTMDETGHSIYEATHVSRLMSEQLLQQLNPALGNVVQATTMAARGFQGFSGGMALVAVGGAGVVAILAQLIASTVAMSKAQAEFNVAARGADLSALRGQLQGYLLELEQAAVRQESVFGKIFNFFSRGFGFAFSGGGGDPTIESAKRLAAIGRFMEDFQAPLQRAQQAVAELAAGRVRVEQGVTLANERLDVRGYDAYVKDLSAIIDLQRQAADVTAQAESAIKMQAATERSAGATEIKLLKEALDSQLVLNKARADAEQRALRMRALAQRPEMVEKLRNVTPDVGEGTAEQAAAINAAIGGTNAPLVQLGQSMETIRRQSELFSGPLATMEAELGAVRTAIITFDFNVDHSSERLAQLRGRYEELVVSIHKYHEAQKDVGEATAENAAVIDEALVATNEPLVQLGRSMEQIRRTRELLGSTIGPGFDAMEQELAAVRQTIINFDFTVDNASERLAVLKARFQDLSTLSTTKSVITDLFTGVSNAVNGTVQGLLQGTQTIQQAFANMGRNIAASLMEQVINQGLKAVEKALFAFLADIQKSGLTGALIKFVAGLGISAASAAAAPSVGATGLAPSTMGEVGFPATQHGGVFSSPQVRMIAEAGPEAVIPLHGGAVPVVGGGVVVNVINNVPNTTTEHSERQGPNGQRIHDIIIAEVRTGAAQGELEGMFGAFGGRRQAIAR